jgi:4-hydroxy-2-oxoheptanedioate aldolase
VHQAGAAPMVRVPVGDLAMISRALDFGAQGIIAPMINTEADARALVAAAKYPPIGERSWGPHRSMMLAEISDPKIYLRKANDLTITLAMIETRAALDNLEAIFETEGIDGVFVGPFDLSIALAEGKSIDPDSKEVDTALTKVAKAANKIGKIAGVYCPTAKRAQTLAKRGFRFVTAGSDIGFLRLGLAAAAAELKG